MKLTKTDFIHYLNCPESLWLLKNRPEEYPQGEFSLFIKKLIKDGYEVEKYAQHLFPQAIQLNELGTPRETLRALMNGSISFFQAAFQTKAGAFARIDVMERLANNSWHLYEIKSSNEVSTKKKHNHTLDACFQKYVLQENGLEVSKVSIIHLNRDYIKDNTINVNDLLVIADITEKVNDEYSGVVNQINAAITLINKSGMDTSTCSCLRKTRSNHCDSFNYFNQELPKYPIHQIKRISEKKVNTLIDNGTHSILGVSKNFELNLGQQLQVKSYQQDKPILNYTVIVKHLDSLTFPLHFFDYETFASAVPKLDGTSPHAQIPFQVSIHTLQIDGTLSHFEYLADKLEMPNQMVSEMQEFTGLKGTFVSWHASFEISRNRSMMEWMPEHNPYLVYINSHMFDLEKIFIADYIDYRFKGSSSIKKVLPVLVPKFSYAALEVQDGTMAMDIWGRMVLDESFNDDIDQTKNNLLEYCKLDTLAMVEIYHFLKQSID